MKTKNTIITLLFILLLSLSFCSTPGPKDLEAAKAHSKAKEFAKARVIYEKLLEVKNPALRLDALKGLIGDLLKQKKNDEALKELQKAVTTYKDNPQDLAGLFLQVGSRYRNSDLKKSLGLIDKGLEFTIDPADYRWLYTAIHIKFVDGGLDREGQNAMLKAMQEKYGSDERIAGQIAKKQSFLAFLGSDAPEIPGTGEWLNIDAPLTMADQKGKYVLLDFSAPWCPDCRRAMPDYLALAGKLKDKMTALVVTRIYGFYADDTGLYKKDIPPEEEKKLVKEYFKKKNVTIPIFIADTEEVYNAFAASAIPHFVLVSPEGKVVLMCMERPYDFFTNVEKLVTGTGVGA